jgi:hypothetical protein
MSNTGETSTKPLRRGGTETPEGVVDIAGIYARIRCGDGVRLAPQRLALNHPGACSLGQAFELLAAAHG